MHVFVTWRKLLLALASLGISGLLFAWSGLFNVAATGGHWPVTDWFLHWVMQNSVRTYSMGIKAPDLSNPELVHRGAGHYQTGCAPCHGSPDEPQNPVMQGATPPPPTLYQVNDKWEPRHLFWIVKHGIRFTGMPGWTARERDDEIWSMVAFLRELPSMSAERYRQLAFGEVVVMPVQSDRADAVLSDCARCHGRDGAGRDIDAFPLIGGQSEEYLIDALQAYAMGRRLSGIMQPATARGDDATLRRIARHYASQSRAASRESIDPALVTTGQKLAREGAPAQGVPACLTCHGTEARARNPRFPNLDGQPVSYLADQLRAWQKNARGGGPYSRIMHIIAERLTPDQALVASHYFASRTESSFTNR
jgi:cytochrome c553